jgi:hypothetical protein
MTQTSPAVLGPVESSVRPRAWLVEDPDPNGPRTFIATQDRDDAYSLATDEAPPIPLYDHATLEAALAARRERCVDAALAELGDGFENLAYRLAKAIRRA